MYSYEYDSETGGLLLNSSPLSFSKEPRPVYYKELDILGFNRYWNYEKNDDYPYMWAEANDYYYRGRKVAQTKGGSIYTAPTILILEDPEPSSKLLRFVDIPRMIEKNNDIMDGLVKDTIKKVYNTYIEYKKKIDVFYVAFSGGKDSIVTLDIVQRALPHNSFKVLFGDTGMEFPDTYNTVDEIKNLCSNYGIDFIRTKSIYSPEDTWKKFGPPATVTRWCCNVHKTVPQIIALRKYTKKPNFTGMAFVGIRASESLSRSEYDYISFGKKHKGQYSFNPILDWNSAELYIYIYSNNLIMNETYKKGNRRAGCLVCPRAAGRNDYISQICYPNEFDIFINAIKEAYKENFTSEEDLKTFIENGGWKARKNGRDISIKANYTESVIGNIQILKVTNPKTEWKTWIKTIGVLLNDTSPYHILFQNEQFEFSLKDTKNGYDVIFSNNIAKYNPSFVKLLKNVFRKAACCVMCQECEVDCHNGYINMKDGKLEISEKCNHCFQCHKVEKGCLVYKSLGLPKGGTKMNKDRSLNCYSHHAPKKEWFNQYFTYKNEFADNHSLGYVMYNFFKRFLKDAELSDENGFSNTATIIETIGLDEFTSWAIMFVNLSYTPQINWYVKHINMNETYIKDYVISLLIESGAKESWVKDVWSSFGRFTELPFKDVGMGYCVKEKGHNISITRTPWKEPEARVILYSLFKFAEACDNYYQFTLNRLLNHNIESDGVSPTEIFGLNREQMEKILNGLSINYPDFISTAFNLGLNNITLNSEKKSQDVLNLFLRG